MVLGTRGRRDLRGLPGGGSAGGGFGALRLGSITHAVLHDAPHPVAVNRDGDENEN
jgi:hypothetical protein